MKERPDADNDMSKVAESRCTIDACMAKGGVVGAVVVMVVGRWPSFID